MQSLCFLAVLDSALSKNYEFSLSIANVAAPKASA